MESQQPRAASKDDGFPYKQLGVLAVCRLGEPIAFCSILAYSFVMVQDIKGEKDASFYSGLLVSAFAVAEACTAILWGDLSDKYGRKPIIMIALAGTALSSLLFGFAKNYWVALFARAVGGLLNGNQAVLQTMVAEIVRKPEHEPRAYAIQPFMWSLGSIAGSSLGGFTAQPARFYPGLFSQDGIFGEYPYLLPNLISVGAIVVAMTLGWLFLEETNPAIVGRSKPVSNTSQPEMVDETTPLQSNSTRNLSPNVRSRRRSSILVATTAPLANDPNFDLRRPSMASITSIRALLKSTPPQTHSVFEEQIENAQPDPLPTKTFTKQVILWTVALCLMAFHQMAFATNLPIYLLDEPRQPPRHLDLVGGLGHTLPQVGTYLAVYSIISLLIQGFVFPIYVEKLGVWRAVASLTIFAPVVHLAMPLVSLLPHPRIGVYVVMALQCFSTIIVYPCILILLKNATPSPLVLGRVNGLAMSGCSGVRTIAPPLVGIIYSSLGSAAAWWTCAVVAIVALVEFCFIPRPKDGNEEILRRASISFEES